MNLFLRPFTAPWITRKIYCVALVKQTIFKSCIRECATPSSIIAKANLKILNKRKKKNINFGAHWFFLTIPVTAFALGTWQITRKIEKDELIRKFEELAKMEPVALPEKLDNIQSMEYQSVKVRGKFDHSKEIVMGPKVLKTDKSIPSLLSTTKGGYLIITPFKLSDRNLTILVNRGWVPYSKKLQSTRLAGQVVEETEIVGVIRTNEKRSPFGMKNIPEKGIWMYKDVEKMSEVTGAYPLLIDSVEKSSQSNGPIGGQTTINLENNHLSYIFTWYGLCAATSFMYYLKFIKV